MPEPTDYGSFFTNVQDPVQAYYAGQTQANARAATAQQQQFQAQQNQASLTAAQLKAQAIQTAIAKPTQDNYRAAALTDPDHAAGILGALGNLTDQQRLTEVGHAAAVDGYLQANQPDQAAALVQQRIGADQAAGIDTSDDQALLNLINTNPAAAKAHTGIMMASLDPKTFASVLPAVDANQKQQALLPGEVAAQPGQQALTAAQAAAATAAAAKSTADAQVTLHPLPKTEAVTGAFNPDGSPVLINPNASPVANGAGTVAVSQGVQALVPRLIASESSGNPNATNGASTAAGAGQFLQGTWVPLVKQYRPDLAQGKTDAQILALRSDPQLSAQMVGNYATQNAATLTSANLPVNGATLAMSHKLGPQGAEAVLGADPNAPLTKVLPANVIAANPQLKKLTAGQYAQSLAQQFGADPIQAGPVDPSVTGDAYLASLPPQKARLIKAIADGDAAAPTGRSAATGAGQVLMQQVLQYDPTASAQTLATRTTTRKDFTSGKSAAAISAATTVAGHLHDLEGQIDALDNASFLPGIANLVKNAIGGQTSAQSQAAQNKFLTTANTLAQELTKFYRVTGGSESDVNAYRNRLKVNASPVALHSVTQDIAQNMQGKLQSLQEQYTNGMGQTNAQAPIPQGTLNALTRIAGGGAQAASAPPAAAPQVLQNAQGQKIAFDAASNSWKPLQ